MEHCNFAFVVKNQLASSSAASFTLFASSPLSLNLFGFSSVLADKFGISLDTRPNQASVVIHPKSLARSLPKPLSRFLSRTNSLVCRRY